LLLKQQGVRVFETLLFDMDQSGNIVIYIDEVNMHHKIKLRDDPRIDSVIFFEEELVMVAHLKSDNNSAKPKVNAGERLDEFRKVTKLHELTGANSIFAPEELLIFKIFDKIKVKVDTTTEFPLDIKCTLVFGKEDLEEYARLSLEQEARFKSFGAEGNIIGGQEGEKAHGGVVEIENLDADV
jgi:hypothetical protein